MIRQVAFLIRLTGLCTGYAAETPSSASDAGSSANPLLAFLFGSDEPFSIQDKAKELPSIRNPAYPKQCFKAYEVWGFRYTGQRIRFLYCSSPVSGGSLMGQEILEYARL
jgi:hypothetical protein